MTNIAVLDYRFTDEIKVLIQNLASNRIDFPTERCHQKDAIAKTVDASVVLVSPWEVIDKNYLDACRSIKYLGLCGTSTANIDLVELQKRNIVFTNIVSHDKSAVGEFVFMQLTGLARGIGPYQWKPEIHELKDKRIGIIGLGDVGQAIAHLTLAYNMTPSYYGPRRKLDWEERGISYMSLPELLQQNEILILCSPTNVEVLGQQEFDLIKPGSILFQVCAGNPFDKPSFYNWIAQDGNYALFDMSAGEANYQLYKDLPRVIFSREVAGDTYESNVRRGMKAIENLQNFLESC